jgi:hypothetical protein
MRLRASRIFEGKKKSLPRAVVIKAQNMTPPMEAFISIFGPQDK